jgi:hypothetical protein
VAHAKPSNVVPFPFPFPNIRSLTLAAVEAALKVLYAFGGDTRVPRTYGGLVQEQRRLGRAQEDSFAAWRTRDPRT